MTTSGTSIWNATAVAIITSAYRKVGAVDENETPTDGMYSSALFSLNSLVKEWMASGIHVWTEQEGVLFLQKDQSRYLIGGTTTDNYTDNNDWQLLTLTASAASGASSITVISTTGVASADYIGVVLDSGTTQWTTVNGAPTSTVVTLTATLTGAAASGNFAFAYTTKLVRPLKIPGMRSLTYSGLTEIPLMVYSRKEYTNLPNKASSGPPNIFFYSPQLVSGELFVWPVPANSQNGMKFTWYRPIQDFNSTADTGDIPQEWVGALVWNLAVELAVDFGVPLPKFQLIKAMADEKLEKCLGWDREMEPIYFVLEDH